MLARGAAARAAGDLLGAAVAGAGIDRDRGRPVPRAVLARPLAMRCRRSAAPIGLFVFFVLAVAATVPLFRLRWPTAIDGLRRLDRNSRLPHRPATAIADRMAPEAGDQFAVALWRAHVERALRAAHALKAGTPVPQLAARDPYALRGLVARSGGRDVLCRRRRAHQAHRRGVRLARRGDAGQLPDRRLGDAAGLHRPAAADPAGPAPRRAVAGARRRPGDGAGRLDAGGPRHRPVRTRRRRQRRHRRGQARGEARRRPRAPRSAASPSPRPAPPPCRAAATTWSGPSPPSRIAPPTIALAKEPEAAAARLAAAQLQDRGRLRRGRRAGDVRAQARCTDKPAPAEAKPPRPLFGAPNFTLVLPQARTRNGAGQTTKDLSEHPWAGVDVTMTLVARDEASNEGRSSRARDAAAGAAVRQAAAARADRAAPQSGARRQRQGPRAERARCAHDRAGAVHAGNQRLSRPALDLLAACARRERRRPARRGGAAVGDGGVHRGRQRLGRRRGVARGAGRACARRWSAARPTKRSRS